jgi:hypothetical protein
MKRTVFARARDFSRATLTGCLLAAALLLLHTPRAGAEELPEYRLKALFLYNFALFTEWPDEVGGTLNLCVYGADPFGSELDALRGKPVGARSIAVQRKAAGDSLGGCQIVFIAAPAFGTVPRVLEELRGLEVLTVADSPGAATQGIALNLSVVRSKITFEANLPAARGAGLNLSSKLLRLATQVIQ